MKHLSKLLILTLILLSGTAHAVLPTIFATQSTGNVAASLLDTNFTFLEVQGVQALTTTGTGNSYIATPADAWVTGYSSYTARALTILPNFTNTGASTINVSNLGTASIYKNVSGTATALVSGDMVLNIPAILINDGANFLLTNPTSVTPSVCKGNHAYTSGSGNFTAPSCTTSSTQFKFTLTGAGGGGGGGNGSSGGGAGATAIYFTTSLTANSNYAYVIGTGGAGGSAGAGGSGNNSTLTIGLTTITAAGGTGGPQSNQAVGGAGGTASNGTMNIPGGDGITNSWNSDNGGNGGASYWGGGGAGGADVAPPVAGSVYGSGGGGSNFGTTTGAAGADGALLVEWD